MIEGALFLNLSVDLRIDHITTTVTALVVHVVSTQVVSCCPLCGQASDQIHSRYLRVVADVPCGNRPVRLHLEVRKLFCRNANCPRKIFTERLPDLLHPSARLTNRFRTALQAVGISTGGVVGALLTAWRRMQGT